MGIEKRCVETKCSVHHRASHEAVWAYLNITKGWYRVVWFILNYKLHTKIRCKIQTPLLSSPQPFSTHLSLFCAVAIHWLPSSFPPSVSVIHFVSSIYSLSHPASHSLCLLGLVLFPSLMKQWWRLYSVETLMTVKHFWNTCTCAICTHRTQTQT